MVSSENPFKPFEPVDGDLISVAAQRSDTVAVILSLVANAGLPVAILTGSAGVGKSTIIRSILPEVLSRSEWLPVRFVCSPRLSAEQVATDVAIALGFSDKRYTRIYEERALVLDTQEVGDVKRSSRVSINQVAASAHIEDSTPPALHDFVARINALIATSGRPVAILLDQVEQLFLAESKGPAMALLEDLFRSATVSNGQVAVVAAVRDRYIYEIIQLAANFPGLSSNIVAVHGFSGMEAREFIRSALGRYGVEFTAPLVGQLIARLQGPDGRIWPIALHACCRPLAEIANHRRRRAHVGDLEKLGDLSGVLAKAVGDKLTAMDPSGTGDALFVLSSIASFHRTEGPALLDDVIRLLPSYPPADLSPMVDALVGLHLLERDRSGAYRPCHDSIASAVTVLRSCQGLPNVVNRLDEAVSRWSNSGEMTSLGRSDIAEYLSLMEQPTPHLVYVGCALFQSSGQVDEFGEVLRDKLHSKRERQLVRVVSTHARSEDRLHSLGASEFFVLMLDGRAECVLAGLEGLRAAAAGPDLRWLPTEYHHALALTSFNFEGPLLEVSRLETWPTSAARVIIRRALEQDELELTSGFLQRLWSQGPRVLRTDILHLAARHSPEFARPIVHESLNSETDYIRAAGVEVTEILRFEGWVDIVINAANDPSALVRRRAVYMLPRLPNLEGVPLLEDAASNDNSPFVREAAVECMGDIALEGLSPVVVTKLADEVDIVRESAVYALQHIVGPVNAAQKVRPLLNDSSPHVREAALRVLSIANEPPRPDLLISDLRSKFESLRLAALKALSGSSEEVASYVLSEILNNSETEKETLASALHAVSVGRHKSTIPEIARIINEVDEAEVLCEAAVALQSIGGSEASELLNSMVFHPSADVRERAVYGLAEIGGLNAVNALTACLYDPVSGVVARAVYGLARLRASNAREAIRLVSASTDEIRKAVEYFFREVGSDE